MPWKALALATASVISLQAQGVKVQGFQTHDFQMWARRLEARGVTVSAGIWDAATGKVIERHQDERALIPASTTKAVTTYALLKSLKPDFILETEVWGDLKDGVVQGDLTFKGDWDPLLISERVWLLAQELKKLGVLRVTGDIRLDQSASDGQREPQGWENTTVDSLPSVLPLSVNFNRDEAGRQVPDPEGLSRGILRRILQDTGIVIEGKPSASAMAPTVTPVISPAPTPVPSPAPALPRKLLAWPSPPLRSMVMDINKWSNNFMIEMLVRKFGAGSWPRGLKRIQEFYRTGFHLEPETIQITDGSGLSKANRLSARTLAIILRGAYHDFEVGSEFISSLKIIGGEPWKLTVTDSNLTRRARVKTGHLDGVTTLCGYLQTLDGQIRVFAILLNGPCRDEDVWEQVSRWAN